MRPLVRPLLAGLLGLAAIAAAGDAAPSPRAQAPPPPATAPTPTPTPAAAPQEREIEDFVPSEKVSADDAVSFPTDI